MAKTIRELVLEYFKAHPNEELTHDPVVDWVTEQRVQMGHEPPRDVWRVVRQLYQEGLLVNTSRGVYKYDPEKESEMAKTIRELVLEYFKAHPNEELTHDPVVDWVTEQRVQMGYNPPRDVWREVRKLHEEGILVNSSRGVYKYDPESEV